MITNDYTWFNKRIKRMNRLVIRECIDCGYGMNFHEVFYEYISKQYGFAGVHMVNKILCNKNLCNISLSIISLMIWIERIYRTFQDLRRLWLSDKIEFVCCRCFDDRNKKEH